MLNLILLTNSYDSTNEINKKICLRPGEHVHELTLLRTVFIFGVLMVKKICIRRIQTKYIISSWQNIFNFAFLLIITLFYDNNDNSTALLTLLSL